MKIVVLLTLIACLISGAIAGVYKWVDEHGDVHYSDKPPAGHGGQEVELPQAPSSEAMERAKARQQRIEEQLNKSDRKREEQRSECDQARSMVRELSLPGPGVIHLEMGSKIIVTGKKKDKMRRHYEAIIRRKCP
ncbi:MAG: DUF4124 domain-containing protein [Gammaproteobacteria bacterium]|nr:DUF4124 domain-containing protein [Gammaproteobacteria bacterium]